MIARNFGGKVNHPAAHPEGESWQQSIYDQLHRLAEAALARETPGHSLQPTLIVNDAYLRLLEQKNIDPADRSQVMAAGATIIRRLLVDYARQRKAQKRGGENGRGIPLQVSLPDHANHIDILDLTDALVSLSRESPRAAQVVEMRFFGGLKAEEIAEQLGVSPRTISNDWRYAKAWLYQTMGPDTQPTSAKNRNDH
jgi:RNA polymerase sigma-70 factor (ECF subfamily)